MISQTSKKFFQEFSLHLSKTLLNYGALNGGVVKTNHYL